MKINKFIPFAFMIFSLLLVSSCSIIRNGPKISDDLPMVAQALEVQITPDALRIDQSANLKMTFTNLNADTITFPAHSRFVIKIPVGSDTTDVVDQINWKNLSAHSSSVAWTAQKSGSTNGLVTFALAANPYKLALKDNIFIEFNSVKPSIAGSSDIALTLNIPAIKIPPTVKLKKTAGAISMNFTAGPNTIITATDKVEFNWAVQNANVVTFNGQSVQPKGDTTLNYNTANLGTHPYVLKASANGNSKEETILVYLKSTNEIDPATNSTPTNIWSSNAAIFRIKEVNNEFDYSNNGISGWQTNSNVPPEKMASSPAVFHEGISYLLGGSRIAPKLLSNEIYFFKNESWSKAATVIPGPKRMGHAALVFKGKLYIIGGFNEFGNPITDVYSWDWGSNWTTETSLPDGNGRGVFMAGVRGDSIWIGGGFSSYNGKPVNNFMAYDGSKWNALEFNNPPTNLCAGSFQNVNGNFYIITTVFNDQKTQVSQAPLASADYTTEISKISLSRSNNKWSLLNSQAYDASIASQCFDINTTYFNGALWIRSMNFDKTGTGFWYFIP